MRFSNRTDSIKPFKVMEVLARANELRQAGHDVIDMEVGQPDFSTPQPIVEAAHRALDAGLTGYTDATGLLELRSKLARFYSDQRGIDLGPERIVITAGGSAALLLASALLTNAGDEESRCDRIESASSLIWPMI